MAVSVFDDPGIREAFAAANAPVELSIKVPGKPKPVTIVRPFPSPADWRRHWIYEIMVDRFNNPTGPAPVDWNRKRPDATGRFGGTFEGIRSKLGYLEALGVGALWLTPVLKNRMVPAGTSHHGYGIYDLLEIDPRFASDPTVPGKAQQELVALVAEAHARGIYVILDIVLNHLGDVFEYADPATQRATNDLPWANSPYATYWREEATGAPRTDWSSPPATGTGIGPAELLTNTYFRRQGEGGMEDWCTQGDFCTLKELKTDYEDGYRDHPVLNVLIRSMQHLIAVTDADGFRIDTLKFIEADSARTFCNAVREYAYSIGKENFFIFGESKSSDEAVLARYTGRNTLDLNDEQIGADAQLDFNLCWTLGSIAKGFSPVEGLLALFAARKKAEEMVLTTHGEASKFFVTFCDCHDDYDRFLYPRDGGNHEDQLLLAVGCLFGLQGIPCIYYGTEAGLKGTEEIYAPGYDPAKTGCPEYVREALWGKPGAFDPQARLFQKFRELATIRKESPALAFGRQYFREVSGNGTDFGLSAGIGGLIAFSRVLNDQEVVVVANTSTKSSFRGQVLVDDRVNAKRASFSVAYSNKDSGGTSNIARGFVNFYKDGAFTGRAWGCRVPVALAPCELQVLTQDE